ncbi:hypothetical protein BH10ACT11_BH10ACT11_12440 [soil metagenome]
MAAEEKCDWCGVEVEGSDGFRAFEAVGERRAVFCRLEHIVPWALHGAHWNAGVTDEPAGTDREQLACSYCDKELGEAHVMLVRHRGEHRIADDFCSPDHMLEWAKAGGRWAT